MTMATIKQPSDYQQIGRHFIAYDSTGRPCGVLIALETEEKEVQDEGE